MPKKAGIVLITLGAVLIGSALLLLFHNQREATQAGQEAESLLVEVESLIAQSATKQNPTVSEEEPEASSEETLDPSLPVQSAGGYDYVGAVSIPALELTLPVLSEWDYSRLQVAPCRQLGSSRTDDLVIAAHNYYSHFGRLKELQLGDTVIFTDMDGIVNTYAVAQMDTVDPYDVDSVLSSAFDLVLYTCTTGGQSRTAVFCTRAEEAPQP